MAMPSCLFLILFLELSLPVQSSKGEFSIQFLHDVEIEGGSTAHVGILIATVKQANFPELSASGSIINISLSTSDDLLTCSSSENGGGCQNVPLLFGNGAMGTGDVYLTAKSSLEPVIRDREVKLMPVLLTPKAQLPAGVDDVKHPNLTVRIKDNRKLRVGFTREGTVQFEKETVTLYVKNLDKNFSLREPLHMNITLKCIDNQRIVQAKPADMAFPDGQSEITFDHLESNLEYVANITVPSYNQSKYVEYSPRTVQVVYSVRSILKEVLEQLNELKAEVNEGHNEIKKLDNTTKGLFQFINATFYHNTTTNGSLNSTTAVSLNTANGTTTTGADNGTTAGADNGTTGADNGTTTGTRNGAKTQNGTTTGTHNTTARNITVPAADSTGSDASKDVYMWWVLVGFIVFVVVTVAGYLLYNHRAKVRGLAPPTRF